MIIPKKKLPSKISQITKESSSAKKHLVQSIEDIASLSWIAPERLGDLRKLTISQLQKLRKEIRKGI